MARFMVLVAYLAFVLGLVAMFAGIRDAQTIVLLGCLAALIGLAAQHWEAQRQA